MLPCTSYRTYSHSLQRGTKSVSFINPQYFAHHCLGHSISYEKILQFHNDLWVSIVNKMFTGHVFWWSLPLGSLSLRSVDTFSTASMCSMSSRAMSHKNNFKFNWLLNCLIASKVVHIILSSLSSLFSIPASICIGYDGCSKLSDIRCRSE